MKAADIHKRLQLAYDALVPIFGQIEGGEMRTDTAFALGELTGMIAKVKALVGRDIDTAWDAYVSEELRQKLSRPPRSTR